VGVLVGELLSGMDKKEDFLNELLAILKGKCIDDEVNNRLTFKKIEENILESPNGNKRDTTPNT